MRSVLQRLAACHEALVSRQIVGNVEPANALWVKGVAGGRQGIRIVERTDVNCA